MPETPDKPQTEQKKADLRKASSEARNVCKELPPEDVKKLLAEYGEIRD